MSERKLISSGSPFESVAGYSRAVVVDRHVFIAGTTTLSPGGAIVAPGDARLQTREVLRRLGDVLAEAGSSFADVVRYRVFVTSLERFDEVAEELGAVFRDIRPAGTALQIAALVHPDLIVEIELDAIIGSGST